LHNTPKNNGAEAASRHLQLGCSIYDQKGSIQKKRRVGVEAALSDLVGMLDQRFSATRWLDDHADAKAYGSSGLLTGKVLRLDGQL
jgi:hypothetical protein